MKFEDSINYQLNKYPLIKKIIKRIYQYSMYSFSNKTKVMGNVECITPQNDEYEYFFGYYDKSPWDKSGRYMLCLQVQKTWEDVSPKQTANIVLIDTVLSKEHKERVRKIGETKSWNVQQGCMLQWLGPDYESKIIYNDYRNGKYCAIILTLSNGNERIIEAPVYAVASDGTFALTLDFSRLYNLRPGYGYYNVPEKTFNENLPNTPAIWKINLITGKVEPLLKYTDFATFKPRPEMIEKESIHKVNHLMISPDNRRFMILYRWIKGHRKYSRLITCNVDGSDMYLLSDDDMVSHCFWKDNEHILAYENKHTDGPGYYLMKDKTGEFVHCWPKLSGDGHPSYSPDGKYVVTDSYPDRSRISKITIMDSDWKKEKIYTVAKVFSPFKYDNDTRCDLHPRWNRRGDKICFDGVFEGKRELYTIDISSYILSIPENNNKTLKTSISNPVFSVITPVYNSYDFMERYFNSLKQQTYKNFEIILVDDGSTDGSYEKLVKFLEEYPIRSKLIKLDKNSGPGYARNVGLHEATGEWVTFIDNDDWVDQTLFERILGVISNYNIHCVIYDYFITNGKDKKIGKSMYCGKRGEVELSKAIKYTRNHAVGKFYKLSDLKNKKIEFPVLHRCEDIAFVARALDACRKIFYLDESLYYYYQRKNSLSNDSSLDETDLIKAYDIISETLKNKYPNEIREKSVPDLLYGATLIMSKSGKSNTDIKNFVIMYEKMYPQWYRANIIKHLGKSKAIFLKCLKFRQYSLVKYLAKIHSFLVSRK